MNAATEHVNQPKRGIGAGASDFVMKKNLAPLAPARERKLRQAAIGADHRRAEIELRKLSLAVRQSGTGIVITDPAGLVEFVNPKFEAMTGYSAAEVMGKNPRFLKSGMTPLETYRDLWETITAGKEWRGEIQNRKKIGELYWESQHISPVLDDDGRILHFIAVKDDITERKNMEQAVRRAELMYRAIFDNAVEGIFLVNPEGRVVSSNPMLARMLGYESAAEMGKDIRSVAREVYVERGARGRFRELVKSKGVVENFETQWRRKDGSTFWVSLTGRLIEQETGGAIHHLGMARDITERKQAVGALRESEEELHAIFEGALDGILVADVETRKFLKGNAAICRMLGYSPEEFTRLGVSDIHPKQDLPHVVEQFERALRGEIELAADLPVMRKDGSVFYVDVKGATIRLGGKDGLLGIFRDVSKRREAFAKITRLNRVYAVLSGINALIVRARDRDELFKEACRVAVEAGGFRMAWLGVVDPERMQVTPVAWHGTGMEYIQSMPVRLGDLRSEPPGLAVQAVKERKAMISNDMTQDPRITLRKEALERGFHSLAVLPLLVADEAVGVLALYAGEVGFFDEEEMKLLHELAGDIAYALDHIEKAKKLDYLAYYDSLTGLANRTLFQERLSQYLRVAQQGQGKLALVLADVERLKTINDSLGRQVGDALLKQLAERLGRATDPARVARVGGDQFAIVLPDIKGRSEVGRTIERLWRDCFAESFWIDNTELRVSAKSGIALFPNDGANAETLFSNAEAALQRAQETGERHQFHSRDLTAGTAEELTLENKLRQALEKDEFVLHYQPKVDLETRRIVGVEALIRWQSPELGVVPPAKFIPLMEETGLILEVGAWALQRAARDHICWMEQGLAAPRVAVNVSAIQLRRRNFVATVEEALKQGAVPPGIDLEITESLIMDDIQGNIEKLKAARGLGVSIAIDDFGTGYSSLGYLAKLPLQALKIDRSFIITMLNDPDTITLVQTIISLAHSLRLKVIAEGVETEEQAKMLRLLRCDEMQGYLFSKPLSLDEMTELLGRSGNPVRS